MSIVDYDIWSDYPGDDGVIDCITPQGEGRWTTAGSRSLTTWAWTNGPWLDMPMDEHLHRHRNSLLFLGVWLVA